MSSFSKCSRYRFGCTLEAGFSIEYTITASNPVKLIYVYNCGPHRGTTWIAIYQMAMNYKIVEICLQISLMKIGDVIRFQQRITKTNILLLLSHKYIKTLVVASWTICYSSSTTRAEARIYLPFLEFYIPHNDKTAKINPLVINCGNSWESHNQF